MQTNSSSLLRLPQNMRKSMRTFNERRDVYRALRRFSLNTVCEEARCPNIGECFSQKTATFMIMGDRCTRRCHFCSVTTKKPSPLNPYEPAQIAQAAFELGLDYVVITSVDRDDLNDYGANHFVLTVNSIKERIPHAVVELLTPDFRGRLDCVDQVLDSPINVFGHNIETVARLYKQLRPQSDYLKTQNVLRHVCNAQKTLVKSGLMVGLGESDEEVLQTLDLLKDIGVQIVTIGQYLRPSLGHWPVARYVSDESYECYRLHGKNIGLSHVFAGPFVRSSYHAKEAHNSVI